MSPRTHLRHWAEAYGHTPLRIVLLLLLAISAHAQDAEVVVGSKTFTEGVVLGEVAAQAARMAGVEATHRREIGGTRVLWSALLRGDIDAYPEYTGTLAEDPLFAARFAELENEVLALELTQLRMVSGSEDGKPNPASSILKLRGSELQQSATEMLMDIAGPDSLPYEAGEDIGSAEWAQRSVPTYLNYRKVSIYGGSNEVQRQIIASTILGL